MTTSARATVSLCLEPDDALYTRWWDSRLGESSTFTRPSPTRPTNVHDIPDMDHSEDPHDDDMLRSHYVTTSPRCDSSSSGSSYAPPATPESSHFSGARPAWTAPDGPGARQRHPVHQLAGAGPHRRRPSSVSSASSSLASKATAPRSILSRAGSHRRATGPGGAHTVKFIDRPVVLSCKYEVDDEDEAAYDSGVELPALSATASAPPAPYVVPVSVPEEQPAPDHHYPHHHQPETRGRAPKKTVLQRLALSFSPKSSPAPSRSTTPARERERERERPRAATSSRASSRPPPPPAPFFAASHGRASPVPAVQSHGHGGRPVISGPMPLGSAAVNTHMNAGPARSVRSVRSTSSLGGAPPPDGPHARGRGGLKGIFGRLVR